MFVTKNIFEWSNNSNGNFINSSTNSKSTSFLMNESEKLELDKEDIADEQLMNSLLWKYVKGVNSELPAQRRIFLKY